MNEWIMYLVKSGLALWLFYGIYWLFLRKETYFSVNRFVLLGSVVLSFLLPLVPFSDWIQLGEKQDMVSGIFINLETALASSGMPAPAYATQPGFLAHWSNWLLLGYMAGMLMLLGRLVWQWVQIIKMRSRSQLSIKDGMKLALVKTEISPFSWFNFIFINHSLPPEEDLMKIVKHEKAHYNKFHYIDLLVIGLAGLIQWFNPVMWFFDRSIREIHEFEADREVLRWNPNVGRYQALLVNQITGLEIFRLANGFSKSLTKKRMIMMTKAKSTMKAQLKVLALLPAMVLISLAFSQKSGNFPSTIIDGNIVSGKVILESTSEPLPGVHVIVKGTTNGTMTGMDGTFEIEVSDNKAKLVFSFVGLETVIAGVKSGNMVIKMSPSDYQIDMDRECYMIAEEKELPPEEGFWVVEDLPAYPHGTDGIKKYLQKNMQYPDDAKKEGIEGIVHVSFVVSGKGEVKEAKVVKGVHESLDKEALRLVYMMTEWTPGKQHGKAVQVRLTLPVAFKLSN
ncbi:MAG: TonB family protein [Bacteroidales bacterium]|nr:TonB family protein [Bacteroidales bacterium]